jgi:hypothetical protein
MTDYEVTNLTAVTCLLCNGAGHKTAHLRVGESDFEEHDVDCPVCSGSGMVHRNLQAYIHALEKRNHALSQEAHDWWTMAHELNKKKAACLLPENIEKLVLEEFSSRGDHEAQGLDAYWKAAFKDGANFMAKEFGCV